MHDNRVLHDPDGLNGQTTVVLGWLLIVFKHKELIDPVSDKVGTELDHVKHGEAAAVHQCDP